jgi:hypothetical protein
MCEVRVSANKQIPGRRKLFSCRCGTRDMTLLERRKRHFVAHHFIVIATIRVPGPGDELRNVPPKCDPTRRSLPPRRSPMIREAFPSRGPYKDRALRRIPFLILSPAPPRQAQMLPLQWEHRKALPSTPPLLTTRVLVGPDRHLSDPGPQDRIAQARRGSKGRVRTRHSYEREAQIQAQREISSL